LRPGSIGGKIDRDVVIFSSIHKLAVQGQVIAQPADLMREPHVFEFLKIAEPYRFSETQLEPLLCDGLQRFLMELGEGFTCVGCQSLLLLNQARFAFARPLPGPLTWKIFLFVSAIPGKQQRKWGQGPHNCDT
jgi:hypothetical protein